MSNEPIRIGDDWESSDVALQHKAISLEQEVARLRGVEQSLLKRERDLADFLENAAEGLHRVAGDGTIMWANRAELEMLGYEREEYVGRSIVDFHVDLPVIQSILAKLQAGETLYDQPARLLCKDGKIKHVLIHSNGYFEEGKLAYTRCFTRDASDRVARHEAERQRNSILMQAPVAAALLTGPEFTFRLANSRFCEMVHRHLLVGKKFSECFPDLADSALPKLLKEVYRTGEPFAANEFWIELSSPEGRIKRALKINLEPLAMGNHGKVHGVIVVAVDISDQVTARQSLERAYAEREHLLTEVKNASRAKDEFLAMLGHELRNPLSPIVTSLQLMKMRGVKGAEREQAIIQRQVEHLVRLVDDLLDVSKITRGKIELKRERARLADVLAKAVEIASLLLEQRSHRLAIECDYEMKWEGDTVRLAQVVANLLTNAARYTPVGGNITLSARSTGESVEIAVQDNGSGIAPEMLPRIFDLFFQGHRSADRAEGGLGIGLALVRNLVELHGGTVTAYSDGLGRGSRFTVCLPLGQAFPPEESPTAIIGEDTSYAAQVRRKVLLVDDNIDGAITLGELLKVAGHVVKVLHDPVAALQAVDHFKPDVTVLDIGLPVMDGYELVQKLKERLGAHPCHWIALTGYGQDGDRQRSAAAGFDDHLVKPIDPRVLLERLSIAELKQ